MRIGGEIAPRPGDSKNFRLFDEPGHVTSPNICRAGRAKSIVRAERVCEKRDRRKQSPFGGGMKLILEREASALRKSSIIHGRVGFRLRRGFSTCVRFVGGEQTGEGHPVRAWVIRGKIFRDALRRKNSRWILDVTTTREERRARKSGLKVGLVGLGQFFGNEIKRSKSTLLNWKGERSRFRKI